MTSFGTEKAKPLLATLGADIGFTDARNQDKTRKFREREVAREIKDLPRDERLRVWRERTGRSEAALYRRLAELDGFSNGEK